MKKDDILVHVFFVIVALFPNLCVFAIAMVASANTVTLAPDFMLMAISYGGYKCTYTFLSDEISVFCRFLFGQSVALALGGDGSDEEGHIAA